MSGIWHTGIAYAEHIWCRTWKCSFQGGFKWVWRHFPAASSSLPRRMWQISQTLTIQRLQRPWRRHALPVWLLPQAVLRPLSVSLAQHLTLTLWAQRPPIQPHPQWPQQCLLRQVLPQWPAAPHQTLLPRLALRHPVPTRLSLWHPQLLCQRLQRHMIKV